MSVIVLMSTPQVLFELFYNTTCLICMLINLVQIPKLREESRRKYLGKRRLDKLDELRDDITDEGFLYGDTV